MKLRPDTLSYSDLHSASDGQFSNQITNQSLQMTTMSSNIMTTTDNQQPYFDFSVHRNITVSVGQTGFLHCGVERLGDKDVSTFMKRFNCL